MNNEGRFGRTSHYTRRLRDAQEQHSTTTAQQRRRWSRTSEAKGEFLSFLLFYALHLLHTVFTIPRFPLLVVLYTTLLL
jgi:hypothetical protein